MIGLRTLLRGWPASPEPLPPLTIAGLTQDSRRVRDGDAFVALPGASTHGLDHAADALAAGACVVLHDERDTPDPSIAESCVAVRGLASRTVDLVRRFHGETVAGLDLVAVTGTNGKSSVAWLLAQALDGAMIGTLGIGRPGSLQPATHTTPDLFAVHASLAELAADGIESIVLEASSHALDQGRLAGLTFTAVAFTNLGHDHLDYHGSFEAYGAAKARCSAISPAAASGSTSTIRSAAHWPPGCAAARGCAPTHWIHRGAPMLPPRSGVPIWTAWC